MAGTEENVQTMLATLFSHGMFCLLIIKQFLIKSYSFIPIISSTETS